MKLAKLLFVLLLGFNVAGKVMALQKAPEGRRTPVAEQTTSAAGLAVPEPLKRQQRRLDRLMPAGTAGRAKAIIIIVGSIMAKAKEDEAASRRPEVQARDLDGWVKAEISRQFGSLTAEQTQLLSLYVVGKLLGTASGRAEDEYWKIAVMQKELNQLTREASALLNRDDVTIRSILARIR